MPARSPLLSGSRNSKPMGFQWKICSAWWISSLILRCKKSDKGKEDEVQKSERPEGSEEGEVKG